MTELLNGRATPSTQCFNALPKPPLLFFSISSRTLINEAAGLGRMSLKPEAELKYEFRGQNRS